SVTEMEAAYETAIEHLRARGEVVASAELLTGYGRFLKAVGSTEHAERVNDEAIEALEPLGPSPQLASAYSSRAGNHMLAGRFTEWKTWTDATLELADRLGLPEYGMRALQYRGIYRVMAGNPEGRADLEEALRLGLDLG